MIFDLLYLIFDLLQCEVNLFEEIEKAPNSIEKKHFVKMYGKGEGAKIKDQSILNGLSYHYKHKESSGMSTITFHNLT